MTNGGDVTFSDVHGTQENTGQPAGTGKGVKIPFTYKDYNSGVEFEADDLNGLYINLIEFAYKWAVINGNGTPGEDTYAYIMSGATSPFTGQMGMMSEFSADSMRSCANYCYLSFKILVPVLTNMKLLGYWDPATETDESLANRMSEIEQRMYVGNEDLLFKIKEGYWRYDRENSYAITEEKMVNAHGLLFAKDIWRNFLSLSNEETINEYGEPSYILEPAADPKDGVTSVPEGAYIVRDIAHNRFINEDAYHKLDEQSTCYEKANVEFDLVIGDDSVIPTHEYGIVVALGKKERGNSYQTTNMLYQFLNGNIDVYNLKKYAPGGETSLRFGPNYRYHFEVSFDVKARTYTTTITQTWPETSEPITRTYENYAFRRTGTQIDYVDSVIVSCAFKDCLAWVENVVVKDDDFKVVVGTGAGDNGGAEGEGGTEDENSNITYYYQHDFENESVNGTVGVVTANPMPTVSNDGNNHYMLISAESMVDVNHTDEEKTMIGVENLIVEMKLKLPSETTTTNTRFRYRDGSGNVDFLEIVTATDGTVGVWTRDDVKVLVTQLSATEWVELKIAFDFNAGKCVVTSGDNTIVYTKAFTTALSANWFRFYNRKDSQLCVDDLRVYSSNTFSLATE